MARPDYENWSGCPMRYAMGILGDRWSLLIVRDMIFNGYSKFGDFLATGEGISTTVLTDRLGRLERAGVLHKLLCSDTDSRPSYLLTNKGMELIPVILQFILWAAKYDEKSDVLEERAAQIAADPGEFQRSLEAAIKKRDGLFEP